MRQRKSLNLFSIARNLGCLVFALSAVATHAQTVALKLRNGDRISGNIISENTNHVVFSNIWTKTFTIPLAEILSRETNALIAASTNAAPVITTNAIPVVTTNVAPVITTNVPVVVKTNPPTPATVVVAAPKPAVKPRPFKDWHGDAQVGMDVGIGENDRQLYYGRFKVTYAPVSDGVPPGSSKFIDRFRNTFDYNASYGTVTTKDAQGNSQTALSANLMAGSSKTDFDLAVGQRAFVYNLFGAGYDEIRQIDLRYEVGPGIGYHLFTRTNFVMNTEVGMNYQAQHFKNGTETEQFFYRFAEDLSWKISKALTFDEKMEFFPQVNFEQYRFRFESNLRYWLLENISFNLTILDIYDTQVAPNVDKNDLQIRSSVGVKF